MKKSRFTEEQIVRILKEVEAGARVIETSRKHGIGEAQWKSKYAGLARLKRMYADWALEHHVLTDVLSRKR